MPNLWRHPVGSDPAFLMDGGRLIGEWYPNGELLIYVASVPDEAAARRVLEVFARDRIASLESALEESGQVTAEMLARMQEQSALLAQALRERDEARDRARAEFHKASLDEQRILDDSALLDWCETIAAAHPELQRDGLVPMTRSAIRKAMEETKS